MEWPNLTVPTGPVVTRVVIRGKRAQPWGVSLEDIVRSAEATEEVVLPLGQYA
jgi:choline dehydrogenase-like flavoprotein